MEGKFLLFQKINKDFQNYVHNKLQMCLENKDHQ